MLMQGKDGRYASVFQQHQQRVELFMRSCLGKGIGDSQKTPGGLLYRKEWSNTQSMLRIP